MIKKTYEYLTGRYHPDLVPCKNSDTKLIHHEIVSHLEILGHELKKSGFELYVLSGFRNHLDQLRIWNEKVEGKRPICDLHGSLLDVKNLSDEDIVKNICHWSAIPGASRHHWGTDIDIYCRKSIPSPQYQVQLTQEEVSDSGIFGNFHQKLDEILKEKSPFYRPYQEDQGGVLPERWHLSYFPIANKLLEKYSIEVFEKNIRETDIHLKEVLLHDIQHFYETYVLNVALPPKNK
jgi:LAS superfamily LD-carboxypeptidase LdcB